MADATERFGRLRLVVNPRSGRGRVGKALPALRAALDARGVDYDVRLTACAGDAEHAARAAVTDGLRYVAAVGGDGTVLEVVNGLLDADGGPLDGDVILGVAASGSGGDFARTYGLDRNPEVVARHLASAATMTIDVGHATFHDADGSEATRLFANIAQVGWGAEVVRRAARMPRWVGRPRYLLAAYGAIAAIDRTPTRLELARAGGGAGRAIGLETPLVNLVVANGQFFGGGMKVAPRALPDDGRFNVLAFTGERSQVFTMTPRIYRGEHLPHPAIAEWQSSDVAVTPVVGLPVEADGEVLGRTPARFRVVPGAVRLKI